MSLRSPRDISAVFDEGAPIDEALRQAVREEMLRHKKLGLPVVEYVDGKIIWVPSDEIQVDEPDTKP